MEGSRDRAGLGGFAERGEFTKALDGFDDAAGDVVHFLGGIEAAKAEADGAVRKIVVHAERLEDVTRLDVRGGAGGAGGNGHVADAHH